jgi:mRNA interferase RelE/StbE
MAYTIELSPRVVRQLKSMPDPVKRPIEPLISSLARNPRPATSKNVKELDKCYRLRSADFRVIYAVYDDKLVILLLSVADRKEAYTTKEMAAIRKELRRRLST